MYIYIYIHTYIHTYIYIYIYRYTIYIYICANEQRHTQLEYGAAAGAAAKVPRIPRKLMSASSPDRTIKTPMGATNEGLMVPSLCLPQVPPMC